MTCVPYLFFPPTQVPEASLLHSRYLNLSELLVEEIIWVGDVDALCKATCHIEGCKVVGIDCEWKPNYIKGSKPNKVITVEFSAIHCGLLSFDLVIILDTLSICFVPIYFVLIKNYPFDIK